MCVQSLQPGEYPESLQLGGPYGYLHAMTVDQLLSHAIELATSGQAIPQELQVRLWGPVGF